MIRSKNTAFLLVLVLLLASCSTPAPGTDVDTATAEPATATVSPDGTATTEPALATVPATEPTTAELATATVPPAETEAPAIPTPYDGTFWTADNIFNTILGPTPAPEGWQVKPCEGEAPLLCILDGEQTVGLVELNVYPLDTHTDFQAILADLGLEPGTELEPEEARAALADLAEQYFDVIEADRQVTYPDDAFIHIEPEPVRVGEMPGLAFGFVRENAAGEVQERYLSFNAFDGRVIYWLTAPYDPANITTFVSDEILTQFEPYLRDVVAGLKLPPPLVETGVEAVTVVAPGVPLTTLYGL
ncbi:MAG TPA: hypothetical protein VF177_13475, partial [Anaerolineae bacterium]